MTSRQYGTLKHIFYKGLTVEQLSEVSMVTFGSMAKRGWVFAKDGKIVVTEEGLKEYREYHDAKCNFTIHEHQISERVRGLLHLGKLKLLKRSAA